MSIEFTLQPQPRFKADVAIPRAGLEAGILTFTFKHLPLNEVAAMEKRKNQTGLDFVESITDAWALPDDFTRDNLTCLANNYPQALEAIITTFYRELLGQREKN
ncbi:phage tail assembly chaperone [Candidatus Regiella insecticola]|uniref:Hypothetical phage protein n=1 Tax=Candidatus Regiella insecticola TaxID=138073 RepID=A0A6L2ZKS0_9ENTR|nr:phage tail assembly chaperone [Candidatus Regiella insecticola]GFN45423.1 hypothetical phage protein [Candidatus Regiella insecticola]